MELLLIKRGGMYAPYGDESKSAFKKLPLGAVMRCELKNESTGTIPMLRTWRGWMGETARHMAAAGCTMPLYIDSNGVAHGKRPFRGDDAHDLFTSMWLGCDENGNRYSWSISSNPELTVAPMSKRLYAMDKHVAWCAERGIKITIPRTGEYAEGMREQER
ncbi:MAG: hypothetical protein Q8L60_10780 [Gammaproteobacteria bacterium]|nr:hypothetical protein [Gammaproteobacteria bacterium]MDP2346832.1 hypothetical protein [Gammaproteobacteria bacterium]